MDTSFTRLQVNVVKNVNDFLNNSNLGEMKTLRGLLGKCSSIFKTPRQNIELSVVQGYERTYCFTIHDSTVHKNELGKIYFIYPQKRLDIYTTKDYNTPLYSWVSKKLVFSNVSEMEKVIGSDKVFSSLINSLVF